MRGTGISSGMNQALYHQAFKYFSQGYSNHQIMSTIAEKSSVNQKVNIKELLQPSLELIIDQIEKIVTQNLDFRKKSDYLYKKNKFINFMIEYRKFDAKADAIHQQPLTKNFLKASKYFCKKGSLDGYGYLQLQKIFVNIFYSVKINDKKYKIKENKNKYTVSTIIPQLKSPKQQMGIEKDNEMRSIASKRSEMNKAQMFQNGELNNIKQLEQKKRLMEALKLQHDILLKKSQMMGIQTEIKRLEECISQVNQSNIVKYTKNSSHPFYSKKKQKKALASKLQKQKLIMSKQKDTAKLFRMQQEESQSEPPEQIKSESPDSEYQIQRQVYKIKKSNKFNKTKDGHFDDSLEVNQASAVSKKLRSHKIIYGKTKQADDSMLVQNKGRARQAKQQYEGERKQTVILIKGSVSQEDYVSSSWHPSEEKAYIKLLQSYSLKEQYKISRELIKDFGKKQRFKQINLRQKKTCMYNICRGRFLASLLQRKILESAQFKLFEKRFQQIGNKVGYNFIVDFLSKFYLTKIQSLESKIFREMIIKIDSIYDNFYRKSYDKQRDQFSRGTTEVNKSSKHSNDLEMYQDESFIIVSENQEQQVVELKIENSKLSFESAKDDVVQLKRQEYAKIQNKAKRFRNQIQNLGITQKMIMDAKKLKKYRENQDDTNRGKESSSEDSMKSVVAIEISKGFLGHRDMIKMEGQREVILDGYKQTSILESTHNTSSLMSTKNPFAIAFNQFTKREDV